MHPQLSITSTTDSRSVQRTVNVLGSENAFQPHSNGETSTDVTENTVTRQDNSTESLSVKNDAVPAVHRRVMHYWRCGKVANKHVREVIVTLVISLHIAMPLFLLSTHIFDNPTDGDALAPTFAPDAN